MSTQASKKAYSVVVSKQLSDKWDIRYVVVDSETGQVLDNAQGYGYKTAQKAHAAWAYKNRDRSKDKEKQKKKRIIEAWCAEHHNFMDCLEEEAFRIAKGAYGPDEKFNTAFVKKALEQNGYTELPFSAFELYKHYFK